MPLLSIRLSLPMRFSALICRRAARGTPPELLAIDTALPFGASQHTRVTGWPPTEKQLPITYPHTPNTPYHTSPHSTGALHTSGTDRAAQLRVLPRFWRPIPLLSFIESRPEAESSPHSELSPFPWEYDAGSSLCHPHPTPACTRGLSSTSPPTLGAGTKVSIAVPPPLCESAGGRYLCVTCIMDRI
ncbi:hypothetical protein CRENBAI_006304 [Crenichthys baileyi]|uniref:Uncharacterized protein n=1 Tax=Crenichthys baileyi TaxID=28760 RepID=A0AAV9RSG2_9TELE